MREIVLRQRAQLDLESIYIYLAFEQGMPKAAQGIVNELYTALERVADIPDSGMFVDSDELERAYRRILVKNYWVYYTYDEAELVVWRVFHTRQDIDTYTITDS